VQDSFDTIVYEERDGVAWLTFARPKFLNAFNEEMSAELVTVAEHLAAAEDVRAVVLRGEGRSFMAGADISTLERWAKLSAADLAALLTRTFTPSLLERLPQPTIAAVDGFAFGMGCEIALGCDFRIVTSRSELGLPEITLGIMPGAGGTQRLPRLIGRTRAAEVVLAGRRISAQEAFDWGLANALVEPEQLDDAVNDLIGRLLDKSPLALRRAKAALVASVEETTLSGGIEQELALFVQSVGSEDAAEGTRAFLEKRRATFTGR
jgi:enoyl-CoA hydratase